MSRRRMRSLVIWLSAFMTLTIISTLLHRAAWHAGPDNPAPVVVQYANNISHLAGTPGWLIVRFAGQGWRTGGWGFPIFAHSASWAIWLTGLWFTLQARRLALAWRAGAHKAPLVPITINVPAPPAVAGPPDSARRQFLVNAPFAVAGLGLSGSLLRATIVDPWDLRTVRYQLPIRDLPPDLDGLRIVQLSDTHLGPRIPAEFIQSAVQRAIRLRPDLVMLTGDYIHAGVAHIERAAELFKPLLDLNVPIVGVLGNHDWYGDGRRMGRAMERTGIVMIDNRRQCLCARTRQLVDRPPASGIVIAGLADLIEDDIDPDAALKTAPRELPCLLLSHNPDAAELPYFRTGLPPRVDVMISGHTHGGQVHIPLLGTPAIPSRYGQKYAGGLVQGPAFPVLISRGVGMSILPVRFGVRPEISEIGLVRA